VTNLLKNQTTIDENRLTEELISMADRSKLDVMKAIQYESEAVYGKNI